MASFQDMIVTCMPGERSTKRETFYWANHFAKYICTRLNLLIIIKLVHETGRICLIPCIPSSTHKQLPNFCLFACLSCVFLFVTLGERFYRSCWGVFNRSNLFLYSEYQIIMFLDMLSKDFGYYTVDIIKDLSSSNLMWIRLSV